MGMTIEQAVERIGEWISLDSRHRDVVIWHGQSSMDFVVATRMFGDRLERLGRAPDLPSALISLAEKLVVDEEVKP